MSVQAIKAGAVDFLTKPVNDGDLLRAVRAALQLSTERRDLVLELTLLQQRHSRLTPREREVMEHVVSGQLNKQIAGDLGTGEQTIKVHRGRIMDKMGSNSFAELVTMIVRIEIRAPGHTEYG
jgi:FixJ family two-component response regulator